ncbi:MAG: MATE family efflux transporter, partial [Cellulosilyticaceae bacterium]
TFMDSMMQLMGASKEVLPYAKSYSNWLLAGAIFTISNLVLNNLLRTEGASKMSMITIIIGAVANIILDPIFMWGLGLGLAGAAIATFISQALSTVLMLRFYLAKKSLIQLNRHTLLRSTPEDKELLRQIFSVGIPVFITQFLAAVAFTLLNSAAAIFGAPALAAMGIVNKLYTIFTQMIAGYTSAFLPFASFNIGAILYHRVKEAIFFSLTITGLYSVVAIIIINAIPEFFIKLFSNDPAVIALGVNCLKMQTYLLVGYAFIMVMTSVFQALGDSKKAGILSLGRQGLLLLPLTLILPKLFQHHVPSVLESLGSYPMPSGLYGVMLAQPLADLITLCLCIFLCVGTFKKLNALSTSAIVSEHCSHSLKPNDNTLQ